MSVAPKQEVSAQVQRPGRIGFVASKIRKYFALPYIDKLNFLRNAYYRLKGILYYRWIFGSFGKGTVLYPPSLLSNTKNIHIGNNVLIRQGARLEAILHDPTNPPSIHIGNNVNIEQDAHIVAVGKVILHDDSGMAPRCSLLASGHPFLDIHDPVRIANRLTGVNSIVEIGKGSMVGAGSVILMNVRIGRHVVVGANSVVKRSVPDYTIVEGNPATVVMSYDHEKGRWVQPKK